VSKLTAVRKEAQLEGGDLLAGTKGGAVVVESRKGKKVKKVRGLPPPSAVGRCI